MARTSMYDDQESVPEVEQGYMKNTCYSH